MKRSRRFSPESGSTNEDRFQGARPVVCGRLWFGEQRKAANRLEKPSFEEIRSSAFVRRIWVWKSKDAACEQQQKECERETLLCESVCTR